MNNLIVLCGLQCSGKSTKAKQLEKMFNATILSSDKIRELNPNINNDSVFKILYSEMNDLLKSGVDVIIYATNTTIKARKQIFVNLKVSCHKVCYIMNTPYETCLNRLAERNQTDYPFKIEEDVIKKYYYSFEIPFYEEGWDEIIIDNEPDCLDAINYMSGLTKKSKGFDQMNKHHTQNLEEHLKTVGENVEKHCDDEVLVLAGYCHDFGKLFTQSFKDGDPNAHYYHHANVGAYELLCNYGVFYIFDFCDNSYKECYDKEKTLDFLFYINYHMHMYNITTEKAMKKWREIFGDKKFLYLTTLNECDKER